MFEDSVERCAGPPKNCQDPVHDSIRSITGYCNDRRNPTDGNALTPIRRLLGKTSYVDGVQEIRSKSVTGSSLPSARLVSNRLHNTGSSVYESPSTNHLHMQIGQFIAHDLIFSRLVPDAWRSLWHLILQPKMDQVSTARPVLPHLPCLRTVHLFQFLQMTNTSSLPQRQKLDVSDSPEHWMDRQVSESGLRSTRTLIFSTCPRSTDLPIVKQGLSEVSQTVF